jgi:large subunit ribosomal protein L6
MNISDPIADMLTRIRNASRARHEDVSMPASRTKLAIARILKEEGFIEDFSEAQAGSHKDITIRLKYVGKVPVVSGLKRISKPGLRVYAAKTEIPRVLGGLGIVIVSTSQGIMTGAQARKAELGGEVLARLVAAMSRSDAHPHPIRRSGRHDNHVVVTGPRGTLERDITPRLTVVTEDGRLRVERPVDDRSSRELHGLTRTLINNIVACPEAPPRLEIQGVGYRAQLVGKKLQLNLGYSHPIEIDPPEGIAFEVENPTRVAVIGIDKELVGQTAAQVRATRKPEPYKGKGVRYAGEVVRRKAGKAGKVGG